MGNDRLSGKQDGSQASRRVTPRLAWIQPVCISINAVPLLKGLIYNELLTVLMFFPVFFIIHFGKGMFLFSTLQPNVLSCPSRPRESYLVWGLYIA